MQLKEPCARCITSTGTASRLRELEKGIYSSRSLGKVVKVALGGATRRLAWGDVVSGHWTETGLLSSVGEYRRRQVKGCGKSDVHTVGCEPATDTMAEKVLPNLAAAANDTAPAFKMA